MRWALPNEVPHQGGARRSAPQRGGEPSSFRRGEIAGGRGGKPEPVALGLATGGRFFFFVLKHRNEFFVWSTFGFAFDFLFCLLMVWLVHYSAF